MNSTSQLFAALWHRTNQISGQPGYKVIQPWCLSEEVMAQLAYIREWGGQFVTAVPTLAVTGSVSP